MPSGKHTASEDKQLKIYAFFGMISKNGPVGNEFVYLYLNHEFYISKTDVPLGATQKLTCGPM